MQASSTRMLKRAARAGGSSDWLDWAWKIICVMSKFPTFMTPERKKRTATQQRNRNLTTGSPHSDRKWNSDVIVPVNGSAVAAIPRPISASNEIGPAPLTTNQASRTAQKMC